MHPKGLAIPGLLTSIVGGVQKQPQAPRFGSGWFADLDCWRSAKVDCGGEIVVGGLLTSIVGGVQKAQLFAGIRGRGLLTSIVGGVQKQAPICMQFKGGLLTSIVGGVQKLVSVLVFAGCGFADLDCWRCAKALVSFRYCGEVC